MKTCFIHTFSNRDERCIPGDAAEFGPLYGAGDHCEYMCLLVLPAFTRVARMTVPNRRSSSLKSGKGGMP